MASTYWISDGITVEAVGANGKLYHTEDILSSPVVWTESGNGRTDVTGVSTKAFAFEVPFPTQLNYVFFSESNGSVEGTVNGNWSQPYNLPLSPGTAINDVQFISNDTKLHWCAVGDSGSIYFFNFAIGLDPSTASIESTTSGIPMKLNGVYRDYNYIYVCGEHGLFLRRPINESTW
jgi:hypothetical protein